MLLFLYRDNMELFYIILLISNVFVVNYAQMQCRDESGKVVDWYVVYKFPRVAGAESPLDSGFKYAFITSDSKSSWTLSNISITDAEKSIFGQTLHSVYATKLDPNLSYINYNDEPPNGETVSTFAHAKGVMATDDAHGFWLIHSVPHFASDEVLFSK